MADSAYLPELAIGDPTIANPPRHSAVVRVTHWITALSFFGLLVSGFAILLSHPRLYWGETGAVGGPSLIDLPLPFVLENQNGWGRYLHFLCAWISVLTGLFYAISGLLTGHFRKNLLPARADLAWGSLSRVVASHLRWQRPESLTYNVVQRLTYLVVVFVLFPLVIWTGLAMSPAIVSVVPELQTFFGGQQSARTIHFFVSGFLVLFLLVHVTMVWLGGFRRRVWGMIAGSSVAGKEGA